jgi:hypothetical protein
MRSPAEIGDGDREAVGAGSGDLDRELGMGQQRSHRQSGGNEQGIEFHGPIITV